MRCEYYILNAYSECQWNSTLTEYQLVFHWALAVSVIVFKRLREGWHAKCNLSQLWSSLWVYTVHDWHLRYFMLYPCLSSYLLFSSYAMPDSLSTLDYVTVLPIMHRLLKSACFCTYCFFSLDSLLVCLKTFYSSFYTKSS